MHLPAPCILCEPVLQVYCACALGRGELLSLPTHPHPVSPINECYTMAMNYQSDRPQHPAGVRHAHASPGFAFAFASMHARIWLGCPR